MRTATWTAGLIGGLALAMTARAAEDIAAVKDVRFVMKGGRIYRRD